LFLLSFMAIFSFINPDYWLFTVFTWTENALSLLHHLSSMLWGLLFTQKPLLLSGVFSWLILRPWRWKKCVSLNHLSTSTEVHGVVTQNIAP
jgi:hypothetical protein